MAHPNETRCRCGHRWRPMAWQERTRNVQCPVCRGWNQVGTVHPLWPTWIRRTWRDHAGERGGVPVCTGGRLHDAEGLEMIRELVGEYRRRRAGR